MRRGSGSTSETKNTAKDTSRLFQNVPVAEAGKDQLDRRSQTAAAEAT